MNAQVEVILLGVTVDQQRRDYQPEREREEG